MKNMKNTITKNEKKYIYTLVGINNRLNDTEEWNSKLEEIVVEITEAENKMKKKEKK